MLVFIALNIPHFFKFTMSLVTNNIQFQKLSDKATIPRRAHPEDAGCDLFSAEDIIIPSGTHKLVKTDICVRLPNPPMEGMSVYGKISSRSGLALKHGINIGAGVVDKNYTGALGVVMFNHGIKDFEVKFGDKIAQLVVELILTPEVEEVDNISTDKTERGDKGFGSSGK